MILEHLGRRPTIPASAMVAPTATVCGDVTLGEDVRVLHGACLIAEGGALTVGPRTLIMENAVVRSSARHDASIGADCLIGPVAHVVGCRVGDGAFLATGCAVFHGAVVGAGAEVRVHGVVHLRSRLPDRATVPIGWVAVGDPAEILPPGEHERIWALQEPLDFPGTVYGVPRPEPGVDLMPLVAPRLVQVYGAHRDDREV